MTKMAIERINFIEMLNDAFLSQTGHGAYAYLSSVESVDLFDRFLKQSAPAKLFIKNFIKDFL